MLYNPTFGSFPVGQSRRRSLCRHGPRMRGHGLCEVSCGSQRNATPEMPPLGGSAPVMQCVLDASADIWCHGRPKFVS